MGTGILAFGSMVDEPGAELADVVTGRIDVRTPFRVEFARSSRSRDGAPTLVRVEEGGARIAACVLVLTGSVSVAEARAMLYRRETGRLPGSGDAVTVGWIAELAGFAGTDVCLYTALKPNIPLPLTAAKLADLAVRSAVRPSGTQRRDGISYLQQQKRRGIETPLMPSYEEAVLARTGARNLEDAWARARSSGAPAL